MKKVLIIDDNVELSDSIKSHLRIKGINTVECVTNTSQATSVLNSGFSPALIISDIEIKDDKMNGIEFIKKLKNEGKCEKAITILQSASPFYKEESLKVSDLFFSKPREMKQLLEALDMLLRDSVAV